MKKQKKQWLWVGDTPKILASTFNIDDNILLHVKEFKKDGIEIYKLSGGKISKK